MVELLRGEVITLIAAFKRDAHGNVSMYKTDSNFIGFFESQKIALEAIAEELGRNDFELTGRIISLQALKDKGTYTGAEDNYYLLQKVEVESNELLKQRALEKLSKREIAALGLK